MSRPYAIRYLVEPWGKHPENFGEEIAPGIRPSNDNFGYTDSLFVASIVRNDDGVAESILLMDSDTMGPPSPEMVKLIRDACDHYLDAHA